MKKILIAIFVIAGIPAFAQFSIGLKGGLSMSNFKVKTPFTDATKAGAAGGLALMTTIGKNISVQADVMYVQKGYNHQICNQCYDKFTTVFIEIPVALRYSFALPKISPKLENFKVHGVAGLYLSQWMNAHYETKLFNDKVKQDYTFTGEKRLDFGPNFGLGLEYTLFAGALMLDYRFSSGMVDMSPPGSTSAQKNKSSILSLTYMYSF